MKFEIKTKYPTVHFSNPNVNVRSVLKGFDIHYEEPLKECKWRLDSKEIGAIEAKQGSSFSNGLGQVIAQAATIFKTQEDKQRINGNDGLPVYMIRTDGLNWQVGILSKIKEKLVLKTCSPISIESEEFQQSLSVCQSSLRT